MLKTSIIKETKEPVKLKPEAEIPKAITPSAKEVPAGEESLLTKQFNLIFENIDSLMGLEISSALEKLQSEYIKEQGYNSVLKNMHNTSAALKSKTYVLSQSEKEDLKMKMNFWRQKLNL